MAKSYAYVVLVIFLGMMVLNGVCFDGQSTKEEFENLLLKMIISNEKAEKMSHQREEIATQAESSIQGKSDGMLHKTSSQSNRPLESSVSIPVCGYGEPVCRCEKKADVCEIFLEVDEIMSFTSYEKAFLGKEEGLVRRGRRGGLHLLDKNTGNMIPQSRIQAIQNNSPCVVDSSGQLNDTLCTQPQFLDGKNYRMIMAVNGQVPGPTIIAYENQYVQINVHNNLTAEGDGKNT